MWVARTHAFWSPRRPRIFFSPCPFWASETEKMHSPLDREATKAISVRVFHACMLACLAKKLSNKTVLNTETRCITKTSPHLTRCFCLTVRGSEFSWWATPSHSEVNKWPALEFWTDIDVQSSVMVKICVFYADELALDSLGRVRRLVFRCEKLGPSSTHLKQNCAALLRIKVSWFCCSSSLPQSVVKIGEK